MHGFQHGREIRTNPTGRFTAGCIFSMNIAGICIACAIRVALDGVKWPQGGKSAWVIRGRGADRGKSSRGYFASLPMPAGGDFQE